MNDMNEWMEWNMYLLKPESIAKILVAYYFKSHQRYNSKYDPILISNTFYEKGACNEISNYKISNDSSL